MKKALSIALFVGLGAFGGSARADQTVVVDSPSKGDSATMIEHGSIPQFNEYQIIDGQDEIYGTPEYDRTRAYGSWKAACNEWKQSMREMNTDHGLLTLNCSAPVMTKDNGMATYKSTGSYKMRVRMKERNK